MPMSEKTAMKIFAVSRTVYSVVVVKGASSRGCLIWTAMNSRPPAIAATAVALVSVPVVMVISCSLGVDLCGTAPLVGLNVGTGKSDVASPDDVTRRVIARDRRHNKPRSRARCTAARRLETPSLVKMCLVWLLSVLRETNSSRAISGPVSCTVEQAEDLQLPVAQRIGRRAAGRASSPRPA